MSVVGRLAMVVFVCMTYYWSTGSTGHLQDLGYSWVPGSLSPTFIASTCQVIGLFRKDKLGPSKKGFQPRHMDTHTARFERRARLLEPGAAGADVTQPAIAFSVPKKKMCGKTYRVDFGWVISPWSPLPNVLDNGKGIRFAGGSLA